MDLWQTSAAEELTQYFQANCDFNRQFTLKSVFSSGTLRLYHRRRNVTLCRVICYFFLYSSLEACVNSSCCWKRNSRVPESKCWLLSSARQVRYNIAKGISKMGQNIFPPMNAEVFFLIPRTQPVLIGWHDIKTADTLRDGLLFTENWNSDPYCLSKAGCRQFQIVFLSLNHLPNNVFPKKYWLLLITQNMSVQQIQKHVMAQELCHLYDPLKTLCFYNFYFQKRGL